MVSTAYPPHPRHPSVPRLTAEDRTVYAKLKGGKSRFMQRFISNTSTYLKERKVKLINLQVLYHWQDVISKHFGNFTVPQKKRLALFSLAVMRCEHCHQSRIANALPTAAMSDSSVRRRHRCLSDEKWTVVQFSLDWARWVMSCIESRRVDLLVDETTIGARFRIMQVSLAYKRRCIPLIWRCYPANSAADYPREGQVKMIAAMLEHLKTAMPDDRSVLVMADRGIGTSPALCQAVAALGWQYLFRVVNTVKIKTDSGILHPYSEVKRGGRWSASGLVFTNRGKIPAHIPVIWGRDRAEPWILVTNNPSLTGHEYAKRNWQEQGFRDLKSGGWQLEMCRLRSAAKLAKFLAILALAQGASLALGSLSVISGKARRLIKTKGGKFRRPLSLFKEGLVYFNKHFRDKDKLPSLNFIHGQGLY